MRKITADWILPVSSPPVENGVVIMDDSGKILQVDERKNYDEASLEVYQGIITPGFINAHCHLELSYMKGKIPEKKGMVQFIIDLIDFRNGLLLSANEEALDLIDDAIRRAEAEMKMNGIVAIGDISNDDYTFDLKAKSTIQYHTFVECFGFFPEKAQAYFQQSVKVFDQARSKNLSASITPHAPYSVSPELFKLIFSFNGNSKQLFSYHNQESKAENEFFKNGSGDFLKLYDHFHLPMSLSHPTGFNSLESVLGNFPDNEKVLMVHNTESTEGDLKMAVANNPDTFFCTCPNANLYIENRLPDYSFWKQFNNNVCMGTDSYASNHQLSILEEMKTIRTHNPFITTGELVQWSTLNGARFFGWDEHLGSIEPGKKPGLNLISNVKEGLELTSSSMVTALN